MALLIVIGIGFLLVSRVYSQALRKRLQVPRMGAKFLVEMVIFLWSAFVLGFYLSGRIGY